MGFHDLRCNGEANALTAGIPIACFGDSIKRFKYTLQVACRHARAAIAYDDPQRAGPPRGEVVIVVGPPEPEKAAATDIDERLRALLARQSLRDAVAQLAAETGLGRRTLYERALGLQSEDKTP